MCIVVFIVVLIAGPVIGLECLEVVAVISDRRTEPKRDRGRG